ncbi:MAG: DMT family transporter, partial [Varibaculum sp.]|nr:DMT family transporter [Varibaculum sp.]
KLGANRTASFVGFSTVVSIIAAVIFLDETFTPLQALGTLVIMGGVYIANMSRRDLPAETQKRNARPSNVTQ